MKGSILAFTIFFGIFVAIGTSFVDALNRFLFIAMIAALFIVLGLMIPEIKIDNLMAMPIDKALLISASPVFFTAFGFHGSIPCLNKYLEGDVKALRFSIIVGSAITLVGYLLWQFSTHGVLSQSRFLEILNQDPTLNGLIEAVRVITGSTIIAAVVKIFSALALITSFLGVALGLLECIDDLLKRAFNISANRLSLGFLTFLPPLLFAFFLSRRLHPCIRLCRTNVCFLCSGIAGSIGLESSPSTSKLTLSCAGWFRAPTLCLNSRDYYREYPIPN